MNLLVEINNKGNKKGFYKYLKSKRKTEENVGPLLNGAGKLGTNNMAKVLNAFFASVFASKTGLQESQAPQTRGKVWNKEDLPSMEKDQVREHFQQTGHI